MQHELAIPAPRYTYDVTGQGFLPDVLILEVDGAAQAHQMGTATLRVLVRSTGAIHDGLTEAKVELVASKSALFKATYQPPQQQPPWHGKETKSGGSVVWAVGSMPPANQPYVFHVEFKPDSVGRRRLVGVLTAHELDGPVHVHIDLQVGQPGAPESGSSQP
jgi:hypothetical protein